MRETRLSGSEGGGAKPIGSPYPYHRLHECLGIKTTFVSFEAL